MHLDLFKERVHKHRPALSVVGTRAGVLSFWTHSSAFGDSNQPLRIGVCEITLMLRVRIEYKWGSVGGYQITPKDQQRGEAVHA